MNQVIEVDRELLHIDEARLVHFGFRGLLGVHDDGDGLLVVLDLALDSAHVELGLDELVVDVAVDLVAFQVAEPIRPPELSVVRHFRFAHCF